MYRRNEPLSARAGRVVRQFFPERQVILRSAGHTRYLTLGTGVQLAVLGFWLAIAGWLGFASVAYQRQADIIADKTLAIERSRLAYRQLLDQVSEYQLSVVAMTRDLNATQSHLKRLFDQNETLRQNLSTTEILLRSTEAEKEAIADGRKAVHRQFELMSSELLKIASKNNQLETHIGALRGQLENAEAQKAAMAAQRAALDDQLWRLQEKLEKALSRGNLLEGNLQALKGDLRRLVSERSAVAVENERMRVRVRELETYIGDLKEEHRDRLQDIAGRALDNISEIEKLIRSTGIKIDALVPTPRRPVGQGGPFIPLLPDFATGDDVDALNTMLDDRLDRWSQLRRVLKSIPLIAPVEPVQVSSRYGRRRDPFNGRLAMHSGVDLSRPLNSQVVAAASGKVVFAGWKGRYGRTIDIDHGYGLSTRYSHLHRILVKPGTEVELGQVIGRVGSSGRSSGPHLHYEVRHEGQVRNPMKFLRASSHVLAKQ